MTEAETYSHFSVRAGAAGGGRPVAVLHLAWPVWPTDASAEPVQEEVFDAASLEMRVANLRRQDLDASVSEAALRALRAAATGGSTAGGVAAGVPARPAPAPAGAPAAPGLGLPGRGDLLRALEAAMAEAAAQRAAGRPAHDPCLAVAAVARWAGLAGRLGPDAAAAVLLGLADRLGDNLRRIDTLAHLGGGVFAACLPRAPRADAAAVAARLRRAAAEEPVAAPGGPVRVDLAVAVMAAPGGDAGGAGATPAGRRAAALLDAALASLPADEPRAAEPAAAQEA